MGRNEELVERIQHGEDQLMVELWVENKRLVAHFSKRYLNVRVGPYDADDLM